MNISIKSNEQCLQQYMQQIQYDMTWLQRQEQRLSANALSQPLVAILPQHGHLIATNLTANFVAPLKLNFCIVIFMTAPLLLYQFWRFIAPGLYNYEKKRVFSIILISIFLFYSSIIFSFFIIIPTALHFLFAYLLKA